jgi:hypothetical protein
MKWSWPHKFVAPSMRMLLTFLIIYFSWVLPTSWLCLPVASGNVRESQDTDVCLIIFLEFQLISIFLSAPTVGRWWYRWAVVAACHCCSWWRWWSDTLWVTLIRILPHSLLVYCGSLVWRFLCNLIDMWLTAFVLLSPLCWGRWIILLSQVHTTKSAIYLQWIQMLQWC